MLWSKVLLGALLGGAVGVLLGRARVCSSRTCNVKVNLVASIVACAAFGAAAAYYLASR